MNWKYKINTKDQFEDEITPELVTKLCTSLITQIKNIEDKVEKWIIYPQQTKDFCFDALFNARADFEHLKELSDGTIPEGEFDNYGFDGDYQDLFNGYLEQLYNIGDSRITTTLNTTEKFIWIE